MPGTKKITILGLGVSGRAALALSLKKGYYVCACDEKDNSKLREFKRKYSSSNVHIDLGWKKKALPKADLIIVSPGIDPSSAMGTVCLESEIPVISELEFGFMHCDLPVLAITGTNGKTTTTELTTYLLNSIGRKAAAAGNIGAPLSEVILCSEKYDFVVVEVSSFQLEGCRNFAPLSAAILNITSDHMNRYKNNNDYAKAKFKIFGNMKSPKKMIIRHDLLDFWKKFSPCPEKFPLTFSSSSPSADFFLDGDEIKMKRRNGNIATLVKIAETKLPGVHNAENIMATTALILSTVPEASLCSLKKGLCEFRTGAHRLEFVGESCGIQYINDSKATNPDAMVAALKTVGKKQNVCLIAGGLDKKMNFSAVLPEKNKIKAIFLYGECRKKLANLWKDDILCLSYNTFESAVSAACDRAEKGDMVLLSPGCASMDMFRDYKERGNKFTDLINRRLKK